MLDENCTKLVVLDYECEVESCNSHPMMALAAMLKEASK